MLSLAWNISDVSDQSNEVTNSERNGILNFVSDSATREMKKEEALQEEENKIKRFKGDFLVTELCQGKEIIESV